MNGATNHIFFLKISKILNINNCANKKAVPDPIAILIEIKSLKLVEKYNVKSIPVKKPNKQFFLQ